MANGDRSSGWWARNIFSVLRFIFALALFGAVSVPLAWDGMNLIGKDFNNLKAVTKTNTVTTPIASSNSVNKEGGAPSVQTAAPDKGEVQTPTRTDSTEESTMPQMWAYMAQLTAWAAMLGISLWAVVALCREE